MTDVSGACCFCFTGFGEYHEPQCPMYGVTMIERQTIDGREASVAYLTEDMQPADKENWHLAKIIFDDGEVIFVTNVEADEEAAGDRGSR